MGTIFAELYEDSIGNEVRNDPLIREYLRFKCQNGLAELEQKKKGEKKHQRNSAVCSKNVV